MSWADFKTAIDQLSAASVFFVNISGGEPFTHPLWNSMVEYAHAKFDQVVVLSNGTILRPAHLRTIRTIVSAKGSFPLQVSLDSVMPQVNAQTRCDPHRILKNLEAFADAGANLVIAMVISRFSIDTAMESVARLSRITKFFHVMALQPVPSLKGIDHEWMAAPSELNAFWEKLRDFRHQNGLQVDTPLDCENEEQGCATGAPCMAAFSHLVIDPDLRVRPCDRLVNRFIGDLRHSSLTEIWNGDGAAQLVQLTVPPCIPDTNVHSSRFAV